MAWMKHNPSFLSAEERIRQFVVRQDELDTLVRTLRENDGPANQHVLVIAPRGRGKTMLVHRLVDALAEDDPLGDLWAPVVFGEESYQVSTAGEFWLEALMHIADSTQTDRWRQNYEALRFESDERRLLEAARARVLDYADALGKRLVLVVENLDTLVDAQLSNEDAWVLRKTLQTEPRLMLVGTAVKRFEGVEKQEQALFEMFRRIELQALTVVECQTLWSAISGHEVLLERAAALRVLTGGSPRLTVLLTQFATGESLAGLLGDLSKMIDEHTDYFKHNIEALSTKMRRVFLALADLWTPSKASAVAAVARLDVNETSSMLKRLEREGRVEVVGKEGRAKIYQVSERLYCIYHLLRRRSGNAARVRAFVDFVQQFYEPTCVAAPTPAVSKTARNTELLGLLAMEAAQHWEVDANPVSRDLSARGHLQMAAGDLPGAAVTMGPMFHRDAIRSDPVVAAADLMRFAALGEPGLALQLLSKEAALEVGPLAVALEQLHGENVVAPPEVLEVAAHVRNRIEHLRRSPSIWSTDPHALPISPPETTSAD